MQSYNLVDFAARFQKGFRNRVVAIGEVPALVESFNHYGCYSTYFFFSDEILTYMGARSDGPASISGYEGKVRASFLPLDLDHPKLTPALEAARRLNDLFRVHWAVENGAVQVYFSGSKGFHLMIDTRLFGRVSPGKNLPLLFDSLRRHLAHRLPEPLRSTVDLAIKDRLRLLRLPNTIHEGSKLYKVVLSPSELERLGPQEIRELARRPRALTQADPTGLVSRVAVTANAGAKELFEKVRRQSTRLMPKSFAYRFRRPADLSQIEFRCAGIKAIWDSRIDVGYRNNCAIRLASELRLHGLTRQETEAKLLDWNERRGIELSIHELQSVVHSAYQHRFPYRYSCRDPILRQFCPLPDLASCQRHVRGRGATRRDRSP